MEEGPWQGWNSMVPSNPNHAVVLQSPVAPECKVRLRRHLPKRTSCCPHDNQAEPPAGVLFLSELSTQKFIVHPGNVHVPGFGRTLISGLSEGALCWSKQLSGAVPSLAENGMGSSSLALLQNQGPALLHTQRSSTAPTGESRAPHTHSEFTAKI